MPRPLTDPQGQKKTPITVFLAPRIIAKIDAYCRPGESRGTVLTRLMDKVPDPPGAPK